MDECLTLLHQLDEDCSDDGKSNDCEISDPDFSVSAKNEIIAQSFDSSEDDMDFSRGDRADFP